MGVYGGFSVTLSENRSGSFSWWGSGSSLDRTDGDLQDLCCWTQLQLNVRGGQRGGIPLPVLIWTKPPHPSGCPPSSCFLSWPPSVRLSPSGPVGSGWPPAARQSPWRGVRAPRTAWSELWGAGWSRSDASCSAPTGGGAAANDPSCRAGRRLGRSWSSAGQCQPVLLWVNLTQSFTDV